MEGKPCTINWLAELNPDSAVEFDREREVQSFHNEVEGLVPLSRHDREPIAA
jgi:hypothetical protein